mmetsp:Transcript_1629/g.5942  ORF Transcript_1629/g.5942 Transcript_1629/m.5942 type:complete len:254 (+) Transcript_1629:1036-1797(+)
MVDALVAAIDKLARRHQRPFGSKLCRLFRSHALHRSVERLLRLERFDALEIGVAQDALLLDGRHKGCCFRLRRGGARLGLARFSARFEVAEAPLRPPLLARWLVLVLFLLVLLLVTVRHNLVLFFTQPHGLSPQHLLHLEELVWVAKELRRLVHCLFVILVLHVPVRETLLLARLAERAAQPILVLILVVDDEAVILVILVGDVVHERLRRSRARLLRAVSTAFEKLRRKRLCNVRSRRHLHLCLPLPLRSLL